MSYIHLKEKEQYQIYTYQKSDKSPLEIATLLEKNKSKLILRANVIQINLTI